MFATDGSGAQAVVGVEPAGHLLNAVDVGEAHFFRSPDGQTLYSILSRQQGASAQTIVTLYDATTGRVAGSVAGHAISLGYETGRDPIMESFSADGRYLGILHLTRYVIKPDVRTVTKVGVDGTSGTFTLDDSVQIPGIEIIDLVQRQSLGYVPLGSAATPVLSGHIEFSPDSTTFYVFTVEGAFQGAVAVGSFSGGGPQLRTHIRDGTPGHDVPPDGVGGQAGSRIRSGAELVRLSSAEVQ